MMFLPISFVAVCMVYIFITGIAGTARKLWSMIPNAGAAFMIIWGIKIVVERVFFS